MGNYGQIQSFILLFTRGTFFGELWRTMAHWWTTIEDYDVLVDSYRELRKAL